MSQYIPTLSQSTLTPLQSPIPPKDQKKPADQVHLSKSKLSPKSIPSHPWYQCPNLNHRRERHEDILVFGLRDGVVRGDDFCVVKVGVIDISHHYAHQLPLNRPFVDGRIGRKYQHSVHSFCSLFHVLYVCGADFPSFNFFLFFHSL